MKSMVFKRHKAGGIVYVTGRSSPGKESAVSPRRCGSKPWKSHGFPREVIYKWRVSTSNMKSYIYVCDICDTCIYDIYIYVIYISYIYIIYTGIYIIYIYIYDMHHMYHMYHMYHMSHIYIYIMYMYIYISYIYISCICVYYTGVYVCSFLAGFVSHHLKKGISWRFFPHSMNSENSMNSGPAEGPTPWVHFRELFQLIMSKW